MKPTTVLLLVSLMIYCYTATAHSTCPILSDILFKYLLASKEDYTEAIAPYAPTPIMKTAAAELKKCAEGLPQSYLEAKKQVLINIFKQCEEKPSRF